MQQLMVKLGKLLEELYNAEGENRRVGRLMMRSTIREARKAWEWCTTVTQR